jgi:hypothetical protein
MPAVKNRLSVASAALRTGEVYFWLITLHIKSIRAEE